jgi:hypothetical protein
VPLPQRGEGDGGGLRAGYDGGGSFVGGRRVDVAFEPFERSAPKQPCPVPYGVVAAGRLGFVERVQGLVRPIDPDEQQAPADRRFGGHGPEGTHAGQFGQGVFRLPPCGRLTRGYHQRRLGIRVA